MGFFSNLFGKKDAEETTKPGGMEDFMTLIRVYFQAVIASELHITNIAALPDLRVFKTTLRVPTQNGILGLGEKSRCKKMLREMYEMDEDFFKEIDASVKRRCRKIQDVQPYMLQFQGFVQETMMLVGNLMKFKLRIPSFFSGLLKTSVEQTVNDIFHKNDFSEPDVLKSIVAVREYDKRLGFSEQWISHFVFRVVMLSKKEKQPQQEDKKQK